MARRWPLPLGVLPLLLAASAAIAGDPAGGEALAQARCSQCHNIGRTKPAVETAIPSFAAIAARAATTEQSVAAVIQGPHMSGLNLPPAIATDIAAYVLSLRH